MKKAFSLIELIIVIIVIGILYSSVNYSLADTSLNQAADQVIYHINYTRHLAMNDNKMQYYPINSSNVEMNRSKYWFKQWWQIRFGHNTKDKHWWYEIFTDQPNNAKKVFDGYGSSPKALRNISLAKNPLTGNYLIGNCDKDGYPNCEDATINLDLTRKYGIKDIKFTNIYNNRLIFDSFGNIYLREGDQGDDGDVNPYDINKRKPLLKTAKITLCKDDNCEKNISICITPKIGTVYLCK